MIESTQDFINDMNSSYKLSGDEYYYNMASLFQERKGTAYSCSHINDALENYDLLSNNQFIPSNWSNAYYKDQKVLLTPQALTYMRLLYSSDKTPHFDINFKLEELVIDSAEYRTELNKNICQFGLKDMYGSTIYSYMLLEGNNSDLKQLIGMSCKAILQATPLNALEIEKVDFPENDYLCRTIFILPSSDQGGGQGVKTPMEDPVLSC